MGIRSLTLLGLVLDAVSEGLAAGKGLELVLADCRQYVE
jgi:hypothetical protein